MNLLRVTRRVRTIALAVSIAAVVLLLAMSAAPVPGPFTGLCDVALVYGTAIAITSWIHERRQLRGLHNDVAAFLQAHA
ncbi:MAG TPA: hypothetical protein VFM09_06035 [Marmoricola sp.]|nr:hypothetical protein [Marmoricola sp.]